VPRSSSPESKIIIVAAVYLEKKHSRQESLDGIPPVGSAQSPLPQFGHFWTVVELTTDEFGSGKSAVQIE
jgi:hypothetical protein